MKCSLCGYKFNENRLQQVCHGCPMARTCRLIKCPNCGMETPAEPKILKKIRKWREKEK